MGQEPPSCWYTLFPISLNTYLGRYCSTSISPYRPQILGTFSTYVLQGTTRMHRRWQKAFRFRFVNILFSGLGIYLGVLHIRSSKQLHLNCHDLISNRPDASICRMKGRSKLTQECYPHTLRNLMFDPAGNALRPVRSPCAHITFQVALSVLPDVCPPWRVCLCVLLACLIRKYPHVEIHTPGCNDTSYLDVTTRRLFRCRCSVGPVLAVGRPR